MFGDYSQDLLRSGIIELKAGDREAARRYLDRALYMSTDGEVMAEAWYWMSQVTDDAREQRTALENCLANDLHHSRARRALAVLDGRLSADEIIDPDMPIPAPSIETQKVWRFTCPKCGGRLMYAPDGRSLVCEYCQRREAIAPQRATADEKDFIVAMATRRGHSGPLREQVLRCQGCGAEFILPPGRLSFACAYCDSPHVIVVEPSSDLMAPDGIVAHAFDQRHATDVLADWLQSLSIEPDRPVGPPRGLYLPVWTFEFVGAIGYRGERITRQANSYADIPEEKEEVSGRYPVLLRIAVAASRRPSAPLARLISNFDFSAVQPYDARFLAAWPAELYDVSMAQASLEARSQAYARLKRDLPGQLAPLRVQSTSSADLSIDTFRMDLLPVWVIELFVAGRGGIVLINGRNGYVYGDAFKRAASQKGRLMIWLRDLLNE